MMKNKIGFVFILVSLAYGHVFAQLDKGKFIGYNNQDVSYMGRIGFKDSCAELYWTGSSITVNVKSTTTVKAVLADDNDNDYYYVIIDNDGANAKKIKVDKAKQTYTLASNLNLGQHKIELFKVTNTDFITTYFYGFEIEKDGKVLAAEKKPTRKIEFFGNSITCGHGAENNSNNSGAPEFFNNYRAYGAITARHFNAQYHCTAKSGIGIMVSWFPEIMPEIYDRLNPKDPNSKWDFSKYTPDIVVINLFQNDSWLVNIPTHEQFKARFGTQKPAEATIINAYKNFVQTIRGKYPNANIICCLGDMDVTTQGSKWPGYVDAAVALLKDKKIVTHFFPYKGTPGHPIIKDHEDMAKDLIAFIEAKKYWK